MRAAVVVGAVLLPVFLPAAASQEESEQVGLVLEIRAENRTVYLGDPIRVSLTVRNDADTRWWMLIPRIGPPADTVWPELGLTLAIVDERGRTVPASPIGPVVKRVRPDVCSFVELHPGDHFGRKVLLTAGPFRHVFGAARFRIKAVVESRASKWLSQEMDAGRLNGSNVQLDQERVFEGRLESNDVELWIREKP